MDTLTLVLDLLKQQNKKQKELTDYLGISKNAFTNWKSGNNTSYIKYLPQIAEFLNCSVDYLLGRTDAPTSEKTVGVTILAMDGDGQEQIRVSRAQYEKIKKLLEIMDDER